MTPSDVPNPTLGLIVPPAHGRVPEDARRLYGDRVRFIARGLGIESVSRQGFGPVMEHIVMHAQALRDAGVSSISLMGTSISFQNGPAFTDDLRARMAEATGLPCTTMSHAIVRAMRALGMRRLAVATSYIDDLNERLRRYLVAQDFEVAALEALQITGVAATGEVTPATLLELSQRAYARAGRADGVLISCGGLQTLDMLPQLEALLDCPAVASSPSGFWDIMQLAGLDPSSPGHGRLFETTSA
jgi:arylmalonate decarboxylase